MQWQHLPRGGVRPVHLPAGTNLRGADRACSEPVEVTDQPGPGPAPSSAARGIAGLVVANSSLILAILIYMGWTYDNYFYGYFHLRTLDLGFGPLEYALRSLSLFSPNIVLAAVVLIAIMSVRTWGGPSAVIAASARAPVIRAVRRLPWERSASGRGDADRSTVLPADRSDGTHQAGQLTSRSRAAGSRLAAAGAVLVIIALALYWTALHVRISTFLLLALLGAGPLLLTWPTRADRPGRVPYAIAIVVAAICALWAASVYAQQRGTQAAQDVVRNLPTRTAVVIYSTQQLALSGPGISLQHLPPGSPYHYRYTGLRLLLIQSGTYYLLPVSWTPQLSFTYVVTESDQARIVLY